MNVARIIGHKEWANSGRKSDPKYSMDWRRAEVAEFKPRTSHRALGSRVLRLGASGDDVTELQKLLGISPADGAFGPKTEAVVKLFQKENGLAADGVVGNATLAAIDRDRPTVTPPIESKESNMIGVVVDEPGTDRQFLCDAHTKRWVRTMEELRALVHGLGLTHMTEKPETVGVRQALLNSRVEVGA